MTESQRKEIKELQKEIKEIQNVLLSISEGKEIFFNIALYKKQGIVFEKERWIINSKGEKVKDWSTYHLTPKGEKFLSLDLSKH